jgi:hypothetical protein
MTFQHSPEDEDQLIELVKGMANLVKFDGGEAITSGKKLLKPDLLMSQMAKFLDSKNEDIYRPA